MVTLYGAIQGVAAIKAEALSIHEGRKPKYHLRAGADYLHFSGLMLTSKRVWAWTGTIEQARKCRRTFDAAAGCKLRVISQIPQHSDVEA